MLDKNHSILYNDSCPKCQSTDTENGEWFLGTEYGLRIRKCKSCLNEWQEYCELTTSTLF